MTVTPLEKGKNHIFTDKPVNSVKPAILLKLLNLLTVNKYYNPEKIAKIKAINAAVINISGRQRMLSQRIAFYCLRIVHCQDNKEREKLRQELLENIELMEISHQGLLKGNWSMNLPGNPSKNIQKIYYEKPYFLAEKIEKFVQCARNITQENNQYLTPDNEKIKYIIEQASQELLEILDIVVSEYQKEKEQQELELENYQRELYHQNLTAITIATTQTNKLKETLQELKNTQSQLIQAEKMSSLGQLLAGIAHEINNPLTFISGNLDYIEEYTINILDLINLYQKIFPENHPLIEDFVESIDLEYIQEDLPKITQSLRIGSQRIKEIIDSLSVFSYQEKNDLKTANIHQCLDTSLLILQHRFKHKPNINILKNYGNLPLIDCYPGQLSQVFLNIINNAIDELENEGTITITTDFNDQKNEILISIKDNGQGINENIQKKIFDPFFTTKPVGKGTGLGLSISYQIIVKRHHGSIKCISQPEKGTEFLIILPIKYS